MLHRLGVINTFAAGASPKNEGGRRCAMANPAAMVVLQVALHLAIEGPRAQPPSPVRVLDLPTRYAQRAFIVCTFIIYSCWFSALCAATLRVCTTPLAKRDGRARTAAAAADLCDDPCTNATRTLYFDGVNGRRADLREMASSRARSLIIGEAPYMILVRAR